MPITRGKILQQNALISFISDTSFNSQNELKLSI